MRRIVVANQKGGVGKTTTTINLAAGLAQSGRRILVVDMDPQANLTFALLGPVEPQASVYDLLVNDYAVRDVILRIERTGIDLLPSTIDLAGAEVDLFAKSGGHTILGSRLAAQSLNYDFIIIDAPPALGVLTINALAAATEVIIPVSTSVFALRGISRLQATIEKVKNRLDHPQLHIVGVLCTMYDHTNVAVDVLKMIRDHFGDLVFETIIPKNVKLEEAHSRTQSVFAYAPNSTGSAAYAMLVQEVLNCG